MPVYGTMQEVDEFIDTKKTREIERVSTYNDHRKPVKYLRYQPNVITKNPSNTSKRSTFG
jgi:hypothetical protein